MTEERLQKVLAQGGFGSRRHCEELILAGRRCGRWAHRDGAGHPGGPGCGGNPCGRAPRRARATPLRDAAQADGLHHRRGRALRLPFLAGAGARCLSALHSVGRLDQDSEGLLLLTNDGELALNASAIPIRAPKDLPCSGPRVFPSERKVRRLQHGVMLDDGPTLPARVTLLRRPPPEAGKPHGQADAGRAEPPVRRGAPGSGSRCARAASDNCDG